MHPLKLKVISIDLSRNSLTIKCHCFKSFCFHIVYTVAIPSTLGPVILHLVVFSFYTFMYTSSFFRI